VKPLYAVLFRVSIWVSLTAHDSLVPAAWAWAIHLRCRRVAEWAWKRWLQLASRRELDAAGKQLGRVLGRMVDRG
jgi:hypothetical protein